MRVFFFTRSQKKKKVELCIDQRHGMFNGEHTIPMQNTYTPWGGTYTAERFDSQPNRTVDRAVELFYPHFGKFMKDFHFSLKTILIIISHSVFH